MRKTSGLTLAELLVACFLFTLFGATAAASLTLALRQQSKVAARVNAIQTARYLTDIIATELRQAVPNSSNKGWSSLTPALSTSSLPPSAPTAVHRPTMLATTSSDIYFMEPHPTKYTPLINTFLESDPSVYQEVRYYAVGTGANVSVGGAQVATNSTVRRQLITYSAAGVAAAPLQDDVATAKSLLLNFTALANDLIQIDIYCAEGQLTHYRSTVSITGR